MRQLRRLRRRGSEQPLRPVLAAPSGVATEAVDGAYHCHDRTDEATYEEELPQ